MEQITENLFKELMAAMDESINDSGQIASSAISLAVERSHDLKINPLITIIMLKYLADLNINLMFEETVKKLDSMPRKFHEEQLKVVTKLIKGVCEGKTHKVTIG